MAAALRSHNIEAIIVDTGEGARELVLELIPEGAEVHSGTSKTLENVGLYGELVESGRYDAIRDEGDHFVGGAPSPSGWDGITTPCTYSQAGEPQREPSGSARAADTAGVARGGHAVRRLELKGKREPVDVIVLGTAIEGP